MNAKLIVMILIGFSCLGLMSCTTKAKEESPSTDMDTTAMSMVDPGPTPEELAKAALEAEAREDSIENEESIENERRLRIIEEEKQRKLLDATEIIKSFSSSFMNRVSPATGKDLNYNILYDESTYDELTKTMNVVFETSWNAVAAFDFGPMEKHIFKGKLIMYGTGETRQEVISKNDILVKAIKSSSAAEDIIEWLNKPSNNNSN